jgi:hypothetical protein
MDDIEIPPITTTFQSNGTAATAVSKYSFLDLLPLDGDAEVVKIPTGPLIPSQPIMVDGKFVGIEAHPMDGSAPRDTYIWAGRDIIIPEAADVGVAGTCLQNIRWTRDIDSDAMLQDLLITPMAQQHLLSSGSKGAKEMQNQVLPRRSTPLRSSVRSYLPRPPYPNMPLPTHRCN